jgi:hypothetical protein
MSTATTIASTIVAARERGAGCCAQAAEDARAQADLGGASVPLALAGGFHLFTAGPILASL